MPAFRIPKMTVHKASGQAVVRLGGKDHYLGPAATVAARAEYDRLLAEWLAAGRVATKAEPTSRSVVEVLAAYWDHAESYYRRPDGSPGKELGCFREALRPLKKLYGHTPAESFGPLALKSVRRVMIDAGLARTNINHRIGRIKRVFKWAVENELVSPAVLHGLQAVAGLKAGRTDAKESTPVRPVSQVMVDATLPFLSAQVRAMVGLQLLTGMRSGEVVALRGGEIDQSGQVWEYRPAQHKTAYLNHQRVVFFGPRAQQILEPFLKDKSPDRYLFSPAEAEVERLARNHAVRKTPIGDGNRPGKNTKVRPLKKPQDRYAVDSYGRAIKYACEKAFPLPDHLAPRLGPKFRRESRSAWSARLTGEERTQLKAWRFSHSWHPHQLRHAAATNLRKTFGLEPAQVILGHRTLTVTQVYAERNVEAARQVMLRAG